MRQQESMLWQVVAMVLAAALIVVSVLAWGGPWDGWDAVAALGGWAAAAGTFAAVVLALRLAKRDADWRAEAHRAEVSQSILWIVFKRGSVDLLVPKLRSILMPLEQRQSKGGLTIAVAEQTCHAVGQICDEMDALNMSAWAKAAPVAAEHGGRARSSLHQARTLLAEMSFASEPGYGALADHAISSLQAALADAEKMKHGVDRIFERDPP